MSKLAYVEVMDADEEMAALHEELLGIVGHEHFTTLKNHVRARTTAVFLHEQRDLFVATYLRELKGEIERRS